jgi:hypothetical protein
MSPMSAYAKAKHKRRRTGDTNGVRPEDCRLVGLQCPWTKLEQPKEKHGIVGDEEAPFTVQAGHHPAL